MTETGGSGAAGGGGAGAAGGGGASAAGGGDAEAAGGGDAEAAGGGGSSAGANPVGKDGRELGPTPEPSCEGPVYDDEPSGDHGQCCTEVVCRPPKGNVCADATPSWDWEPGSGECQCSETGPYLNNDPSSPDKCCYLVGYITCDGRPLMISGEPRLADVVPGGGAWSSSSGYDPCDDVSAGALDTGMTPELRAALSRRWAERARFEHASIASFARFSMALLACGAPPGLVVAAQQAGLDEVRHARITLAFASEHAGRPLDFGPLDIADALAGPMTLEATALATVAEGCVGETLAAIEVAACAAAARPGAVRDALSAVAEDETRHAELAWAFVRWAAEKGGPALRARIAATFELALEQASSEGGVSAEGEFPGMAEHGFLPEVEVARLRRQAIAEVLRPAVAALLSGVVRREGADRAALSSAAVSVS